MRYQKVFCFFSVGIYMIFPLIISGSGKILKRMNGCNYRQTNANFPMGVYLDCGGNEVLEAQLKSLIDVEGFVILTIPTGLLLISLLLLVRSWLKVEK